MAHLTTRQIKRLIEIDMAGKGIQKEVQALICRLTLGEKRQASNDPGIAQAQRWWEKGVGLELGFHSFEEYLGSIPAIPEGLKKDNEDYPLLVLVDGRLEVPTICECIGVEFAGYDMGLKPSRGEESSVYWIRATVGRVEYSVKLSDKEALALFVQHPNSLERVSLEARSSERQRLNLCLIEGELRYEYENHQFYGTGGRQR